MPLRLTANADRDIDEISCFGLGPSGEAQAENCSLGRTEGSHRAPWPEAAPLRAHARLPLRLCPHGSHVILYMLDGDDISVLRVLHGRGDWMEFL